MTRYEWNIEWLDKDDNIIDICHFNTLAKARATADFREQYAYAIALVRNVFDSAGTMLDRQHAYLTAHGTLPPAFENAADIPARYRTEAKRCHAP